MMYEQQTLDFDMVHLKENNSASQSCLEANRPRLNKSCLRVLNILLERKGLTVQQAAIESISNCLPRRIADLEKALNIEISERIIDQKKRIKEWFIPEYQKVLIENMLND